MPSAYTYSLSANIKVHFQNCSKSVQLTVRTVLVVSCLNTVTNSYKHLSNLHSSGPYVANTHTVPRSISTLPAIFSSMLH